ncbi:MAG TPA: hypothetical protein VMV90_05565 [Rectinemataceae bacterium]|nr:hypothetical protein [Rectinemataceae bacterium]
MKNPLRDRLFVRIAAVVLGVSACAVPAFSQIPPNAYSGKLQASLLGSLKVLTADGQELIVTLPPDVLVLRSSVTDVQGIRPGDRIGVDAKRQADGGLDSVAINIFSAALWNRVKKGQFPMESGDVMTNATVDKTVTKLDGGLITLEQGGQSMQIRLTRDVQVHRLADASTADLVPGMQLLIRGTPNSGGGVTAATVTYAAQP